MITKVTCHFSQIISSDIMNISRIENNKRKMNTYNHLFFSFVNCERICKSFPKLSCQSSITSPIKGLKWLLTGSQRKLKVCFLWKIKTLTQHAKFIKKPVSCVCDEAYIGKTIGNIDIRWNDHEDIRRESESAKIFKGKFEP